METGARVFRSISLEFEKQLELWSTKGLVRRVQPDRIKIISESSGKQSQTGLRKESWWEPGSLGFSNSLIAGLVNEINTASSNRVSWNFETTVDPYESSSSSSDSIGIKTTPPLPPSTPPIDILIHTAPTPQLPPLLPSSLSSSESIVSSKQEYVKTFAWLLPSITLPGDESKFPTYWRTPCNGISMISTGLEVTNKNEENDAESLLKGNLDGGGTEMGLVIQATPEQLGLSYDRQSTSDSEIKSAILRILERHSSTSSSSPSTSKNDSASAPQSNTSLIDQVLPRYIIDEIRSKEGKESQIKRWKYAQLSEHINVDTNTQSSTHLPSDDSTGGTAPRNFRVLNDSASTSQSENQTQSQTPLIILAGDGQHDPSSPVGGGIEAAWLSGKDAGEWIVDWLNRKGKEVDVSR